MRRSFLLLLAVVAALAAAPFPQLPASASCVAPYLLDMDGRVLERGVPLTVEGRAFVDGCRDTMTCDGVLGCESCDYDEPPPEPLRDVELHLEQGDRSWRLGVADAGHAEDDRLGWVEWTIAVPAGVRPGRARLVSGRGEPAVVTIR